MAKPVPCDKVYILSTGAEIPALGLGTWKATDEDCYNAVKTALRNGYTHIDTARCYNNEVPVGKAINDYLKESGTPREKLFITTKLWCSECMNPLKALQESLERLGLDYIDLYLTHWPVAMPQGGELMPTNDKGKRIVLPFEEWNYLHTYKDMQSLVSTGLTKAIGVSNYNIPKLERLLNDPEITIIPACNQVEMHPCLPQPELVEYCKSKGILIECYSPLGSTGAPILQNDTIKSISDTLNISPACTAISWGIARDVVLLPKSSNPERIINNLKIVNLDDESVSSIEGIGKDLPIRIVNPPWDVKINIFENFDHY